MRIVRFFETIYADNAVRSSSERRKLLGDVLLYLRNSSLRPVDSLLAHWYRRRRQPIVFIVGAPRSGTTLLYQTIARHLAVGYLCNAVAKFWSAPLVGAILLHLKYGRIRQHADFSSQYGRTDGAFGPHEFSWFWHFWGDFREHDDLRGLELNGVDWFAIAGRLRGLAGFYRTPLVLKSINFTNYQVEELLEYLPDARFLWISREPLFAAQSILQVREKRYGDRNRWWSVRPRDVEAWTKRSSAEQAVHQIRDIEESLCRSSALAPKSSFHRIRYEDLVTKPAVIIKGIADFLGVERIDPQELEETSFKSRNEVTLPLELARAVENALRDPR